MLRNSIPSYAFEREEVAVSFLSFFSDLSAGFSAARAATEMTARQSAPNRRRRVVTFSSWFSGGFYRRGGESRAGHREPTLFEVSSRTTDYRLDRRLYGRQSAPC